ncbi:MAG TPA: tetratricopeptide repeat protein [Pyrinomonadaceae bacterium]|nr:tetratricopeptide repeat protein [Pyrinomonadaceae bacterium]
MSRENVLFSVVGLLLGYVIAFHLVVYVNQSQAGASAGAAQSAEGMPADHPTVGGGADRQRLLAEAEKAAEQARKSPDNFEAQLRAGAAYFEAGSFEDAIDFMTRANKLRPDDYDTVVRLGNVYSSAGRFEDAARWYAAALAKRPEDCDARSELALTFFMRKPSQPEKAITELRRCLQSDPNHVHSLHNLALMLIETKQYAESESTLARLEQIDPGYAQLPLLREELRKARAGAQAKSATD